MPCCCSVVNSMLKKATVTLPAALGLYSLPFLSGKGGTDKLYRMEVIAALVARRDISYGLRVTAISRRAAARISSITIHSVRKFSVAILQWPVADPSFEPEQRREHDVAHALWLRFTTVFMLDEQVRAAGDPEL